jgi:hypothetical protein
MEGAGGKIECGVGGHRIPYTFRAQEHRVVGIETMVEPWAIVPHYTI